MKKHVKLHDQVVTCKTCQYKSNDMDEFMDHVIQNHRYGVQRSRQEASETEMARGNIECYSCGEMVSTKRDLTEHRKINHFKERLCKFYHGNGAACRFPDNVCIDIHGSYQQQPLQQQQPKQQRQQPQQRESVIQENKQYRKQIPFRDGFRCEWQNSLEGCRYLHREGKAQGATTVVNSDQLKELINLVQARLNLQEKEVPNVQNVADFPGLGYSKNKSE